MKIAICDDEAQILRDMAEKIAKLQPESEVVTFGNGQNLLRSLKSEPCDLLFLDIDMPGLSGLEIVGQLCDAQKGMLLVFVTNHDELVYDSLRFHPFGFLRKQYFDDEVELLLRDCEKELAKRECFFTFQNGAEKVRIRLSEIRYFESDGNYLRLMADGREYRFRDTVGNVEKALSEQGFIRLHRGFLVNQEAVKILGTEQVELVTGERLPIGRSYAETAKKRLLQYMRK